jgi:dTDP-4-dehydrorhamnose reductase
LRVLLAGSQGQLGQIIQQVQQVWTRHEIIAPAESEFDITDWPTALRVVTAVRPDVVLNAAAYTDVDGCEAKPELAYKVNALGPRHLASACLASGAALLHISTNCVFDGQAQQPYLEFDPVNPISVYGASKQAGDAAVRDVLARHYIVRTAWLYSRLGRNFVKTILRLTAERPSLDMVADEISSPTYAPDLALALEALVAEPLFGTYHFANEGECSRLQFAAEIARLAGRADYPLRPIALSDYPRPSRPPLYSPLSNTCGAAIGIRLRPWQAALAELVPQLLAE